MKNSKDIIKYIITASALAIALVHFIWPNLTIDAITLGLLLIAVVPWLAPVFKSLKFPGGLEIQFQEFKEKIETIIAKETEPINSNIGPGFSLKAFSVDNETKSVLKALGDPKYTWRYIGGLMQETKLPMKEINSAITWLIDNNLIKETKVRDRRQWALTQEGRDLLNSTLREDEFKAET